MKHLELTLFVVRLIAALLFRGEKYNSAGKSIIPRNKVFSSEKRLFSAVESDKNTISTKIKLMSFMGHRKGGGLFPVDISVQTANT